MGYVYNPSTHSFLTRDIYTYISFAEDQPGVLKLFTEEPMKTGDSLIVEKYLMVLDSLGIEDSSPQGEIDPGNITLSAQFSLYDRLGNLKGTTQAAYVIIEGVVNHRDGQFPETGIHVSFSGISENAGTILVSVSRNKRDFIVVKAVINPYINLIWAGALITFAGLFIAALKRLNRIKKENP